MNRLGRFAARLKRVILGPEDEDLRPGSTGHRILGWFGIHLLGQKRDRLHLRPRFFRIILIAFLCLLALFIGLFEFSTSPRFCNSCHIMRPYYAAWKTSSHNFVPCVECHYPPGRRDELRVKFQALTQVVKFVTRTYGSRPYAEVEDASCLRGGCHDTRLLEGKVTFKRGIVFDHKPHLTQARRGRKLRCTSCHSQIVVGTHMVVTEGTCFLCHFKGTVHGRTENPLAGCPSCHQPPSTNIKVGGVTFSHDEFIGKRHVPCQNCHLDAVSGDGRAPKERCELCHNEPGKLKIPADLASLHDNHVTTHNVDCSRCHEEIVHAVRTTLTPLEYGCDVCHEGKHKAQKQMFMGTGGRDFPAVPSHMFETQLDCTACHTEPLLSGDEAGLSGQTFVASQKACVKCHGEKYRGLVASWKKTFAAMIGELEPKLAAVSAAARKAGVGRMQSTGADSLLSDARYNLNFVKIGRGVHNVFYAAGLLNAANRNLDAVMTSLGEQPLLLGKHSYAGGDYCAVLCHAGVGVEMPVTVQAFNKSMPHRNHFFEFGVSCTECHSAQNHKQLDLKPGDCNACHHAPSRTDCAACHDVQSKLYRGSLFSSFSGEDAPSVMAASVECDGCHTGLVPRRIKKTVAEACETCHDKSYRQILDEWENEMESLTGDATRRLASVRSYLRQSDKERDLTKPELEKLKSVSEIITALAPRTAVHNTLLSRSLLEKALQELDGVESKARSAR
jgi:nitrate/TMAO reductase-like tetraheme cytochrome c subunit